MAYYNEHDPHAAAWLRSLASEGHIPDGKIDTRDIQSVAADDVRAFPVQHYFAGIGGWPLALDMAGWSRDRPVWTGSCPCQPFSSAGKRKGKDDARHLWPDFFRLIRECRPECVFGEQVAGADGIGWLDGVSADLEGEGYTVGAAVLGAHSVGAPHRRQRIYWVAHCDGQRFAGRPQPDGCQIEPVEQAPRWLDPLRCSVTGHMADAATSRRRRSGSDGGSGGRNEDESRRLCSVGILADRVSERVRGDGHESVGTTPGRVQGTDGKRQRVRTDARSSISALDHWSRHDFIPCRDGKTRRAEPGVRPLADGVPKNLGRLWASCVRNAIKEVKVYATRSDTSFEQTLQLVRGCYATEEVRTVSGPGMPLEFPPTSFLFDFLLDVVPAFDQATIGRGIPKTSPQECRDDLSSVRHPNRLRRSSHRRRSDEQRHHQSPDSVPELSRVLARHAQTLWSAAVESHAKSVPLSQWNLGRVGRLRGYGNAIVPQTAALFIRAFMETQGLA